MVEKELCDHVYVKKHKTCYIVSTVGMSTRLGGKKAERQKVRKCSQMVKKTDNELEIFSD